MTRTETTTELEWIDARLRALAANPGRNPKQQRAATLETEALRARASHLSSDAPDTESSLSADLAVLERLLADVHRRLVAVDRGELHSSLKGSLMIERDALTRLVTGHRGRVLMASEPEPPSADEVRHMTGAYLWAYANVHAATLDEERAARTAGAHLVPMVAHWNPAVAEVELEAATKWFAGRGLPLPDPTS